jgi:hypothetical protein
MTEKDPTETPEWTKEQAPAPEATLKHNHSGGDSVKIKHSDLLGGHKTFYTGVVASGGTATSLPTGWTSVRDDTGKYSVTHNLGTGDYSVLACAGPEEWVAIEVATKTTAKFSIWTLAVDSIAFINTSFNFILILY